MSRHDLVVGVKKLESNMLTRYKNLIELFKNKPGLAKKYISSLEKAKLSPVVREYLAEWLEEKQWYLFTIIIKRYNTNYPCW